MAQTTTTTTTTTATSTRDGTQLAVDTQSNTISIGSVVTGVSLQPYIAPRIVSFFAYNIRPGHRVHIFFDSVNVDAYCAPGVVPSTIENTADWQSIDRNGNWGDAIVADENGMVAGQFNIPAATFKTGDRVLQICNVDDLTTGNTAVFSSASATFTSSNLNVTKENLTLTTVNPELSWQSVSQQVVNVATQTSITNDPDILNFTAEFLQFQEVSTTYYDPLAQSFQIEGIGDAAGLYASSIDVYFKQKSLVATNGITLYVCESDNGYPNGKAILPFSTVHLTDAEVNVSEDATLKTRFVFEAPVFLLAGRKYNFILKPDANDPDYFVFMANLGDVDVTTGNQVFQQPMVGTAFYGAQADQWTALQSEYIKFQLNVCSFQKATGNAQFHNANTDFMEITNISYANSSLGLLPGDYVFQSVNASPATANTSKQGLFSFYNSLRGVLYADNTTGNFSNGSMIQIHRFANSSLAASPNTTTLVATAELDAVYDARMDALVGQFAAITPPGTGLDFFMTGTSNAYGVDGTEQKFLIGYENEFLDYERVVASRSNEVGQMSGNKSLNVRAALTSDTPFLSPLIDTVRRQQLVIGNEIDPVAFDYGEFFSDGGAKAKYVSRVVTLRDGMDSEDLQAILTAYRPPTTDIQVWARFVNREDPEPISQKVWAPLYPQSVDLFSTPGDQKDMREFLYTVPKYYGLIPLTGTVTCNTASSNVVGSSTAFTTELEPGWFINFLANSTHSPVTRKVISIANNEFLTLDAPLSANHSGQPMFLVPPPTTPYLSSNTKTLISGNVTTSTTNNAIVGSGTSFATAFKPGSIIGVGGDNQVVVSITNNTFLTVGTPWSSALSGANAYVVSPEGLSYLNSNGSLFTTYNRVQLKVILQADDPARVPLLDDHQCLSLLM